MALSLNVNAGLTTQSGLLPGMYSESGSQLIEIDETFTSEDISMAIAIDVSALKAIYMIAEADAGLAVTYDQNGGPHDWSNGLTPGTPFFWCNSSQLENPFGTTDVTGITVTQTGTSCRFRMAILTDATP